jgi:hypothetical protein
MPIVTPEKFLWMVVVYCNLLFLRKLPPKGGTPGAFSSFPRVASLHDGSSICQFCLAFAIVIAYRAATGPIIKFSKIWQEIVQEKT